MTEADLEELLLQREDEENGRRTHYENGGCFGLCGGTTENDQGDSGISESRMEYEHRPKDTHQPSRNTYGVKAEFEQEKGIGW